MHAVSCRLFINTVVGSEKNANTITTCLMQHVLNQSSNTNVELQKTKGTETNDQATDPTEPNE